MADSVNGLAVVTLADLAVASAGANVVGAYTDSEADDVVLRSEWNRRASVIVSDHPADLGDGNERAIFVSKSLNNIWRLGKAKLGTADGNEDGPNVVIPQ